MEGFIRLVKVLFLGNAVLLTPNPIDLDTRWFVMEFEEPLQALTVGVSLEVRMPRDHRLFVSANSANALYELADSTLPEGSIEAELLNNDGDNVMCLRRVISISKDYISYGLVCDGPLLVENSYEAVRIRSSVKIENVSLYWKNYKH